MLLVSEADFANKLESNSHKVWVIEVFADWCMPCKALRPILMALEAEYRSRATFSLLDAEKSYKTTQVYGVTGLPTVIFFVRGEVFKVLQGTMDKRKVRIVLEEAIAKLDRLLASENEEEELAEAKLEKQISPAEVGIA